MEQRFDDQVQQLRQKVKDLRREHKRQLKVTKEASIEKLINQEEEHQRELKVLGAEKLRDQAIQYRHGWRRSRRSGSSTSCYREKNRQNFPPRNLNTKNKNCHFYPNAYFSESMVSRSEIWPILVFAVSLENLTSTAKHSAHVWAFFHLLFLSCVFDHYGVNNCQLRSQELEMRREMEELKAGKNVCHMFLVLTKNININI